MSPSGFGIDRITLAMQDQALDTQAIVQQLPHLATSRQLGNAVVTIGSNSSRLDSTATKDQTDELRSLLQTSSIALENNHTTSIAFSERHETQTLQMATTLQDVHHMLVAMRLPHHSDPHRHTMPALGMPPLMPPSSSALPGGEPTWRDQSQMAAGGLQHLLSTTCSLLASAVMALLLMLPNTQSQHLLSTTCSLLASAVMALLLMLPNTQSQLRIFMTLLKSPRLNSSNSVIVTDAPNRTKLLPHEYFSNWNLVQPRLENSFKKTPGESRVRGGEHAMFSRMKNGTTLEINREDWESVYAWNKLAKIDPLAREIEYILCSAISRL
jgi:hypothetical protein